MKEDHQSLTAALSMNLVTVNLLLSVFFLPDCPWSPIVISADVMDLKEKQSVSITCSALTPCPLSPTHRQTETNTDGTFTTKIQENITLSDSHDGSSISCSVRYPVDGGKGFKRAETEVTLHVSYNPVFGVSFQVTVKLMGTVMLWSSFIIFQWRLSGFSCPGLNKKSSRTSGKFNMSNKSNTSPKAPQPERLDQVYRAVKRGLESYLHVYQTELENINREIIESKINSRLGFLYEFDQKVKVIEGNIKHLEIHLNKIKGLYEAYYQQRTLRDEANELMNECKTSSGSKETKERSVKANKDYKEYTEKMRFLESKFQSQLGQFHIHMKGLAGFARLCAGDQYEIYMKYGRQRWKLYGNIEINAKQVWENEKMVFIPFIHEFLCVKVTELKRLTSHVVVGNLVCETKDLFAPLPRMVALDINDFGTIKLVLEVTWYPISKDDLGSIEGLENSLIPSPPPSPPPTPAETPPLIKTTNSPDPPQAENSFTFPDLGPPPPLPEKKRQRLLKDQVYESIDPVVGAAAQQNAVPPKVDDLNSETGDLEDSELEDTLESLISSLEEYKEQSSDVQILEDELRKLKASLEGSRHSQSRSVDRRSVEKALSGFDFLSTSNCEDEEENYKRSLNDSPSFTSSYLTTGCSTLDRCLRVHLNNSGAQLMHLGALGPLRCRETYALDRLLREARVLKIIHYIIEDNPRRPRQPTEVIPELGLCHGAMSLWKQCVGRDSVYCVSADRFLTTLSTVYSSILCERTDPVISCLVERILEQKLSLHDDRDGLMVTLFQLWNYLESNGVSDMETHIIEVAEEVWLVQNLSSWDQDVVLNALHSPAECSLKREGVQAVAKLLNDPRDKVLASASSVLRILAAEPRQREQALVNCMEMLEDDDVDTRVCGCKALAYLKATESINQLVYLCQMDKVEVEEAATETLLDLGEEGKMALRQLGTSQDSSLDSLLQVEWSEGPSSSAQGFAVF